jgi:hypothetical protein
MVQQTQRRRRIWGSYQKHPCSFYGTVKKDANEVAGKLTGLNLSDFKDRAEA